MANRVSGFDGEYDNDDAWSTQSSHSAGTGILDYYQSSPDISRPCDDSSSPSSIESEHSTQETMVMKPSPLRIRKSSLPRLEPTVNNPDNQLFFRAFSRPPSTPPTIHHPSTPPHSRYSPVSCVPSISVRLQTCAGERYNAYLIAFTEMLSNHISTVDILIHTTREAQTMRYFAKRLASYGEDEAAKEADKQARMVKLKAVGWRTERFRPERYQDLCQRASEEL